MSDFDDLLWPDGVDNIGGTATRHFYALAADVLTWPGLTATPTTLADDVTIVDDFVMKTGKKFFEVYSTLDTGKVEDKNVGEFDGKSFESSFEFFFPGTRADALGLIRKMNNSGMVFIAVEADGQKRVLGDALFSARLKEGSVNTGSKTADRKGTMIRVETRGVTPAKIYAGDVPLTAAA